MIVQWLYFILPDSTLYTIKRFDIWKENDEVLAGHFR